MSGSLRVGVFIGLALASLPLAPGPVEASHQEFSVYEDWSGTRIRGDRWRGGETSNGQEVLRELVTAPFGQYFTMSLRREGETDSNSGSRTSSTFLNLANPASIDQIEALMGVLDVLVEQCPANATPSEARLLIAMTAFNDGSSTGTGDRTGDYNALVQAIRRSNSADPAGILRVEGRVTRCQNAACSAEQQIVVTDLGLNVAVGAPFTIRLIWDAPNNQFLAGVNTNVNVALPYTANDAQPAAQRSVGIEIRNSTANCVAGATEADLGAGVGTVRTNTPGSPPVVPTTPPPTTPPPTTPPPTTPPPTLPPPFPPISQPTTPQPTTPPPTTPPPTTPPPTTPPPVDNTPFPFPQQPPYDASDPTARYTLLGNDPATGGPFYAGRWEYANPLPGSHLYAGQLPDNRRLWVPARAQPAAIRRVLATGQL